MNLQCYGGRLVAQFTRNDNINKINLDMIVVAAQCYSDPVNPWDRFNFLIEPGIQAFVEMGGGVLYQE